MTSPVIDLTDIQGDILLGLPKRAEKFIFFNITDPPAFKKVLGSELFSSFITSTADVMNFRNKIRDHKAQSQGKEYSLLENSAVNIAFTQSGLNLLGLTDNIGDPAFTAGQLAHAEKLGDNGTSIDGTFVPDWLNPFKGPIDGLIMIAADSEATACETEQELLSLLAKSIAVVLKVDGHVRPGHEKGHEHFGYMDGISSPAVKGVVTPLPGQLVVDPGVLLMGQEGDANTKQRPPWAKNGSILVYRHLNQLVPEFDKFKRDNALQVPLHGVEKGAELLGARMFGRWKSGAPIDVTPNGDDPILAKDPQRNNNFDFSNPTDQTNCPFAAHIRKTNPRSDLGQPNVAPHGVNRTGIAFGPEVTPTERENNKTTLDRGLAFVCYQTILSNGFEFLQETWVNNPGFIFGKVVDGKSFKPGFDPIIGQNNGNARVTGGLDPDAQGSDTSFPTEFVVSKGGAYFFSPSLSVIKKTIGTPSLSFLHPR